MKPTVMSARKFACWKFDTDKPTVTQMNSVTQMCRDGTISHAEKIGKEWFVNCTEEWPGLFPGEDEPAQADPAAALGDLLMAVGRMLKEGAADGERKSDAA